MRLLPLLSTLGLVAVGCAAQRPVTAAPVEKSKPAPAEEKERPAARVNGKPIAVKALDAHATATSLSRSAALEDLIDLELLREVVAKKQIPAAAGDWTEGERARVELDVAKVLAADVPAPIDVVVVDHAWLKDSPNKKQKAQGKASLEKIRALAAKGSTLPDAYNKLRLDGSLWHIGSHERYPESVIPAPVQKLPANSLSPIVAGDGGLHLFFIYTHEQEQPPAAQVREKLREPLRREADIERLEPTEGDSPAAQPAP